MTVGVSLYDIRAETTELPTPPPTPTPDRMSTVFDTLAPIFGLMVLGFGAARVKVVDQAGVRGLVLFVFNFSIPALLLRSMATMELPPDMAWGFLVAFYGGSLVAYGLGMAVGRVGFQKSLSEQAIFGMGAGFSNVVMMGIPVVLTAFGPEASLPLFLIIAFHSMTFMPLTVALIQSGRSEATGRRGRARAAGVLGDVFRNPIILGILAGLAVNLVGIELWRPADQLLDFLGMAAVPCALFAMGGSLAGYPLRGDVAPAVILGSLKLLLHPLLVWVIAVPVLGLEGLWVSVPVVMAAMPSAVNVYLFGERYEAVPGVAARTVLLSSTASLITVAMILTLLGR